MDRLTCGYPRSRWVRWRSWVGRAARLGGHRERTALPRAHPSPSPLRWTVRPGGGSRVSQAGVCPPGPSWANWGGKAAMILGGRSTQAALPSTMIGSGRAVLPARLDHGHAGCARPRTRANAGAQSQARALAQNRDHHPAHMAGGAPLTARCQPRGYPRAVHPPPVGMAEGVP